MVKQENKLQKGLSSGLGQVTPLFYTKGNALMVKSNSALHFKTHLRSPKPLNIFYTIKGAVGLALTFMSSYISSNPKSLNPRPL